MAPEKEIRKSACGPTGMASMVGKYLAAHGGLKAVPALCAKTLNSLRNGGISGLMNKIHKFQGRASRVGLGSFLLAGNEDALNIRETLAREFSTGGILVLDHMYGGGANAYRQKRIAEWVSLGQPVLLLTWDFFNGLLRGEAYFSEKSSIPFHTHSLQDMLNQDVMRFSHILVNELVWWSDSESSGNHLKALPGILAQIAGLKQKNGASLEVALHDYYALCPNYILLDKDLEYCGAPEDEPRCRACQESHGENFPQPVELGQWRKAWQYLFDCADEIRAFSTSSIEILQSRFAIRPDHVRVIPHQPLAPFARKPDIPSRSPMRVGVIGRITPHKGADMVRALAALLEAEEKIIVIGELDGKKPGNVFVHGEYRREDLPALVEKYGITVALIPSIWPETFCYTAGECMDMDLPLVVFPLGAQAERCAKYPKARIASEISAKAALAALRKLDKGRTAGD